MTAAADLRALYSPNAAKKIARAFGIAVVTAKVWLSGRTPTAREAEIGAALLAECDRLEALIAETRQRWDKGARDDEKAGVTARRSSDQARPPPRRIRR